MTLPGFHPRDVETVCTDEASGPATVRAGAIPLLAPLLPLGIQMHPLAGYFFAGLLTVT